MTDENDRGPFDLIGDVHGCRDELVALLGNLGYARQGDAPFHHPHGRRAVFVGDLVDRGPDSPGVLAIVMDMVEAGSARCVVGNHDDKLRRKLEGRNVRVPRGLAMTLEQLESRDGAFRERVRRFLASLPAHLILDGGRLVVAHAGLKESLHGESSSAMRSFCLYGETTGETDELGYPVRVDWAKDYRGQAAVVYGHCHVDEAAWVNNTICLDTRCVFGGHLTALRWPEREVVAVPAARVHYVRRARPID